MAADFVPSSRGRIGLRWLPALLAALMMPMFFQHWLVAVYRGPQAAHAGMRMFGLTPIDTVRDVVSVTDEAIRAEKAHRERFPDVPHKREPQTESRATTCAPLASSVAPKRILLWRGVAP